MNTLAAAPAEVNEIPTVDYTAADAAFWAEESRELAEDAGRDYDAEAESFANALAYEAGILPL